MEIFLGWIIFSFVIAFIGGNRRIGFLSSLVLSLLLSPLIGLIVTLVSPTLESIEFQRRTIEALEGRSSAKKVDEELNRLIQLLNEGKITEGEYVSLRKKLIERPVSYTAPEDNSPRYNQAAPPSGIERFLTDWRTWAVFIVGCILFYAVNIYLDRTTVKPLLETPVIDSVAVDIP